MQGADLLRDAPRLGRPLANDSDRRELLIPFAAGGYVLRNRLEGDDTAVIIRVWHSRELRE
jgi:plasmid stabilization system protein ParE